MIANLRNTYSSNDAAFLHISTENFVREKDPNKLNANANVMDEQKVQHFLKQEIGAEVVSFISKYEDLQSNYVRAMYLVTPFNVDTLPYKSYKGIVNVCRLNFNKKINETLTAINKKLGNNGNFIGCVETHKTRNDRHKERFKAILPVMQVMDIVFHRILANLSWSRKTYLRLTGGNKRVMSKTEAFGRIIRAGFDIVEHKEIGNLVWFVAKKVKDGDTRKTPDYGLFYKKEAIGKNGKEIGIYKIRTMHPYAEYLQSHLIANHGYSDNGDGKIKNDYRITSWGRLLRKLYLDEVPQLLNVLKGDMNLMGVRPITSARLQEFPQDLVEARQAFKPGCIPPYVSLRMGDEKGNMKAEWIYLNSKNKNGMITDVRFLSLAVYNIARGKMWSA